VKTNNIVAKYGYEGYPANPNGSDFNTAMLCDSTGRHLVMMPLNVLRFNGTGRTTQRIDEVSPWHEAFVNAKNGLTKNKFWRFIYGKAF
jgi:phosphoribosylformylglycinamidine synthase